MNCIFASNARCEPSLVCGDCPNNKQQKTSVEHDYKCSYSDYRISVYEDAEHVATFTVVGHLRKHLKLYSINRQVEDMGYAIKYAELYFKAIKKMIR